MTPDITEELNANHGGLKCRVIISIHATYFFKINCLFFGDSAYEAEADVTERILTAAVAGVRMWMIQRTSGLME